MSQDVVFAVVNVHFTTKENVKDVLIEKPFWADSCPVKTCCENKKIECCGSCNEFPCSLLKSFSYDKEQGDNGLRIENCKKWCSKK